MATSGAIVAPSDSLTAVAIIRALGSKQIPVVAFDSGEASLGSFSRYAGSSVYDRVEREGEVLRALLRLGERRKGWVLYPTSDFFVAVIARHHKVISRSLIPTVAPWSSTKYFIDKLETFRLAKSLGIAVPETHAPGDMAEAERLGDQLDFEGRRWLVKVKARLAPQEMLGPFAKAKGIPVTSKEKLLLVCGQAFETGVSPPLVQEEIPGPPPNYVGLNSVLGEGGRPLLWITKRKHRGWPYEFGTGTMWETSFEPEVGRLGLRFAAATGGYGFASVEFKEDSRDDSLKLIEANCRAVLNSEIFRRSGVDLIRIVYSVATGSEAEPPGFWRTGVRWTNLIDDATGLLLDREHYPLSLQQTWRVAKEYLATHSWGLLSAKDPIPFIAYALRRFGKRRLKRSFNRSGTVLASHAMGMPER